MRCVVGGVMDFTRKSGLHGIDEHLKADGGVHDIG